MTKPERIGERLRTLRLQRQLTLEETAALCGVSKPMIGQIERGISFPTVNTLWKLASGLKIPFSQLLEERSGRMSAASRSEAPDVVEEKGAMRVWTLFPFDPLQGYEVFCIELDPGTVHDSPAHQSGVQEMVLPAAGTLEVRAGQDSRRMTEGGVIRFGADTDHSYANPGDTVCRFFNVIFYGGQSHV